ncbi:hypothetical protein J5X84_18355 [Streptosporangiaceae bacterium NEAU-GS5]|nr:hypothetical protein [Streptosporangiaceae bacterium NEAU-GS5]
MIDSRFVFVALCFNVLGTAVYLREALKGRVRPHPVTWFLWALAPGVAFIAQINDGVGLPALVTLMAGVNPLLIFLASIRNKAAQWSISSFDLLCGSLSIVGVAGWLVYRQAGFAVAFSILSDGLAAIPTFRKSRSDPQTESWIVYGCLSVSALITLATIDTWRFANYGFAAYLAVLGISLTTVNILETRRRRLTQT